MNAPFLPRSRSLIATSFQLSFGDAERGGLQRHSRLTGARRRSATADRADLHAGVRAAPITASSAASRAGSTPVRKAWQMVTKRPPRCDRLAQRGEPGVAHRPPGRPAGCGRDSRSRRRPATRTAPEPGRTAAGSAACRRRGWRRSGSRARAGCARCAGCARRRGRESRAARRPPPASARRWRAPRARVRLSGRSAPHSSCSQPCMPSSWPRATISRTASGWCTPFQPSTKNVARTPARSSSAKIAG